MAKTIMRALCVITVLCPERGKDGLFVKALDSLFEAYWVNGRKIHEKEVLAVVLEESLGREEARNVMNMVGMQGKEVLSRNTDQALKDGAFGLPWFMAENEKGEREGFLASGSLSAGYGVLGNGEAWKKGLEGITIDGSKPGPVSAWHSILER